MWWTLKVCAHIAKEAQQAQEGPIIEEEGNGPDGGQIYKMTDKDITVEIYTSAEIFFRPSPHAAERKVILRSSPSFGISKRPWRDFILIKHLGQIILCRLWGIFRTQKPFLPLSSSLDGGVAPQSGAAGGRRAREIGIAEESSETWLCVTTYTPVSSARASGYGFIDDENLLPWAICVKDEKPVEIHHMDELVDTVFVLPYQDGTTTSDRSDVCFYVRKEAYYE